ncbi:MAG TPA: TlyA family rRNA (cytidine-2'-O)-methyltransferase, partial [bacterium]|nr:TlyA family rRNA (cytidine-2'-O)-methyltransferase [bacterium]
QYGAAKVYAIDVGYGQLAYRLRNDARVVNMERTNVRDLVSLPEPVKLVVIDVSFISLRLVLPVVRSWLEPGYPIIALFKPQFEAGKAIVDACKGVIKDKSIHAKLLDAFVVWLHENDFTVYDRCDSPIHGDKGNAEFLLLIHSSSSIVKQAD